MTREVKTAIKLVVDVLLLNVASLAACALQFGYPSERFTLFARYMELLVLCKMFSLCAAGVYRSVWRYAGQGHMCRIVAGVTVGSVAFFAFLRTDGNADYPFALLVMDCLISLSLLFVSRMTYRLVHASRRAPSASPKRVLVVGAGEAGVAVADSIQRSRNGRRAVGFVDDGRDTLGRVVHGLPVLGTSADLPEIVAKHRIDEILLTGSPEPFGQLKDIVSLVRDARVSVRAFPDMHQLLSEDVKHQNPYNVKPEDLLDRDLAQVNTQRLHEWFRGKRILVTGAGGSIGSELCRQIADFEPSAIYLLDHCENGIFEVDQELKARGVECLPVVADVRDLSKLNKVFDTYRPHVVFHAAAHKHVPMMEQYPEEAVKTNAIGARNTARAALAHGCEKFVLVSTDKAVRPCSVMGATKRAAEIVAQGLAAKGETAFITVRFGNVLDSRGSLLPTLRKQIAAGGPVTITHPDMQRYFMTIPEAVLLLLLAASKGENGQLMILDMGSPINILDLADRLIRLSGKVPGRDIDVQFTGMRPGEKLNEELLTRAEEASAELVGRVFVVPHEPADFGAFNESLTLLERTISTLEPEAVKSFIRNLVPEYTPRGQPATDNVRIASAKPGIVPDEDELVLRAA